MSIRNVLKLSPFIVLTLMNFVSISARAEGGTSGGGGDAATEMRIDEIRGDILKWLSEGGGSELVLPEGMTYTQYRDAMIQQLQKHKVVIGAVTSAEEAATQDPELKVLVRGQPKTCRGFLSEKDMRPHILCNSERLKATNESKQYALIHHEFAGLASVEKNVGASSDYAISQQVTDYLVPQTVLKLAVKKPVPVFAVGPAKKVDDLFGNYQLVGSQKDGRYECPKTLSIHKIFRRATLEINGEKEEFNQRIVTSKPSTVYAQDHSSSYKIISEVSKELRFKKGTLSFREVHKGVKENGGFLGIFDKEDYKNTFDKFYKLEANGDLHHWASDRWEYEDAPHTYNCRYSRTR